MISSDGVTPRSTFRFRRTGGDGGKFIEWHVHRYSTAYSVEPLYRSRTGVFIGPGAYLRGEFPPELVGALVMLEAAEVGRHVGGVGMRLIGHGYRVIDYGVKDPVRQMNAYLKEGKLQVVNSREFDQGERNHDQ